MTSLVSYSTHLPQKHFSTPQLEQPAEPGLALAAALASRLHRLVIPFGERVPIDFAKSFERKKEQNTVIAILFS